MDISTEIRRLRKGRGLSQCELATLADLDQAAVSDYERGEHVPTLPTLTKLAHALDLHPAALLLGRESR